MNKNDYKLMQIKNLPSSYWRSKFHIEPPTGLLNDPNGLVYHNGKYHVFFQWHPDAPVHGLKYWNHVTSSDLVNWDFDPWIIKPDSIYETHGSFSGSAIVIDDEVHLFYTGNTRDEHYIRFPYQLHTRLYGQQKNLIIDTVPQGFTDHFRDPKVFKHNNDFYMIIGAQTLNREGASVIFKSEDAFSWEYLGPIKLPLSFSSYMWECPDLIEFENRWVFLFCPQGYLPSSETESNIYPSTYLMGDFDTASLQFSPKSELDLVDYGFDFYAPQTFLDEFGQVTLIGWLGLPEIDYPTNEHGWANMLTLPRTLEIKDGKLVQKPHQNLKKLYGSITPCDAPSKSYVLEIECNNVSFNLDIYKSDNESLKLDYNGVTNTMTLDRSHLHFKFGEAYGLQRKLTIDKGLRNITIFRDTSSVEIFINDGEYVMTSRFFPKTIEGYTSCSNTTINITKYEVNN